MNCPKCDHYCSNVLESRRRSYERKSRVAISSKQRAEKLLGSIGVRTVRRRRECPACAHRWVTLELSVDMLEDVLSAWQRTVLAYLHR